MGKPRPKFGEARPHLLADGGFLKAASAGEKIRRLVAPRVDGDFRESLVGMSPGFTERGLAFRPNAGPTPGRLPPPGRPLQEELD